MPEVDKLVIESAVNAAHAALSAHTGDPVVRLIATLVLANAYAASAEQKGRGVAGELLAKYLNKAKSWGGGFKSVS